MNGPLGSKPAPPCRYLVTVELHDPVQVEQDMGSEEMQRLFSELHLLAYIIQVMSDRFAYAC